MEARSECGDRAGVPASTSPELELDSRRNQEEAGDRRPPIGPPGDRSSESRPRPGARLGLAFRPASLAWGSLRRGGATHERRCSRRRQGRRLVGQEAARRRAARSRAPIGPPGRRSSASRAEPLEVGSYPGCRLDHVAGVRPEAIEALEPITLEELGRERHPDGTSARSAHADARLHRRLEPASRHAHDHTIAHGRGPSIRSTSRSTRPGTRRRTSRIRSARTSSRVRHSSSTRRRRSAGVSSSSG